MIIFCFLGIGFILLIINIIGLVVQGNLKNKGIDAAQSMLHISGLEIPNVQYIIELHRKDGYLLFRHQSRVNRLSLKKIKNIAVQTEREIEHIDKSLSKAIIGGALLGTVGAAIGSSHGHEKKTNLKNYLVISYSDDNEELKHIIMTHPKSAQDIVNSTGNTLVMKFANSLKKALPQSSNISTVREL